MEFFPLFLIGERVHCTATGGVGIITDINYQVSNKLVMYTVRFSTYVGNVAENTLSRLPLNIKVAAVFQRQNPVEKKFLIITKDNRMFVNWQSQGNYEGSLIPDKNYCIFWNGVSWKYLGEIDGILGLEL